MLRWGATLLLGLLLLTARAQADSLSLSPGPSVAFRAWFTRIVVEQLRQGPSPRWTHRDCAGLVRYAVAESLRQHDAGWLRSNGVSNRYLPPELNLSPAQQRWRQPWVTVAGRPSAFVAAAELVQANTTLVGRDINLAQPGDLLYFDQGDDQHLMIWLGDGVAYHTGHVEAGDSGLRAMPIDKLMTWKDSRWQPIEDNPNFIGVFRFSFLAR